jgi:nucleotide-binding universal stress UspA family protein
MVIALRSTKAVTPAAPESNRAAPHPIVAGVDASDASVAATEAAVALADELDAPLVFVHVRPKVPFFLGAPLYQRRLTRDMARARTILARAVGTAQAAGVDAKGEILEGTPPLRLAEFARDRRARLLVVGSRPRKLGRSVSNRLARTTRLPIVVAEEAERQLALSA